MATTPDTYPTARALDLPADARFTVHHDDEQVELVATGHRCHLQIDLSRSQALQLMWALNHRLTEGVSER